MTPLPIPTLEQALAELRHRDEFKVVVGFIREARETRIGDLNVAVDPNDVMKMAGAIAELDALYQVLK